MTFQLSYCSSCSRNSACRSILSNESHQARVSRNGFHNGAQTSISPVTEHPPSYQRYTPTKLSRTPSARTTTGSTYGNGNVTGSGNLGTGSTFVNRRTASARLTPVVTSPKEDANEVKRNEQIKGIRSTFYTRHVTDFLP